ncbi:MAG: ATP phosphoribosyltransferase regulatory subunit, partial [Gemmatimonadaceae bacterium]
NFEDKGGRQVAMRPEMTPTFARMVTARAQALRKPVKWFSIPQLFRYERQQKGRLREHYQLNVDIVGEVDVLADAELLSVAVEIMRALGLSATDVRARVSDRRLLNALLDHLNVTEAQLPVVYAVLDKFERQPSEVSNDKLRDAGIDVNERTAIMNFGKASFEEIATEYLRFDKIRIHIERFNEYRQHCIALGIGEWLQFDLTIVRGLAYYTGIVFELFDAVGEFRAICGGGRYDNLLKSLGGVDLPALGFGMGDVVLGELLRERGKMPVFQAIDDRYFIVAGEGIKTGDVLKVASVLRRHLPTSSVSYGLNRPAIEARKPSKQAEDGRASGANFAINLTKIDSKFAMQLSSSIAHVKTDVPNNVALALSSAAHVEEERNAAMHIRDMARALVSDQPKA